MECLLMILITSGTYVNREFQIELGKIPPCFLPLANNKLYVHQIRTLRVKFKNKKIYISIPNDFVLNQSDKNFFKSNNINIIRINPKLSLGHSIVNSIKLANTKNKNITILHGDTLINSIPNGKNIVGLSDSSIDYIWEINSKKKNINRVWCGYFNFDDKNKLIKSITNQKFDFVLGVKNYLKKKSKTYRYINEWYDLGHLQTYYFTRSNFLISRNFNSMSISDGFIKKISKNKSKILAEIFWFKNIPNALKTFVPNIIDSKCSNKECYYTMEFFSFMPLNELFVHSKKSDIFWKKIFKKFNDQFNSFRIKLNSVTRSSINKDFKMMITEDLNKRIVLFKKKTSINFDRETKINGIKLPSLNKIIKDCQSLALKGKKMPSVVHGDFCLSNIFYDFRTENIKLIDPRGLDTKDNFTIYGDQRYDVAKLMHSIIGLYDHILAKLYKVNFNKNMEIELEIFINENTDSVIQLFKNFFFKENKIYLFQNIYAITILIFFRILALHSEDKNRQYAFIGNILRLYQLLKSQK